MCNRVESIVLLHRSFVLRNVFSDLPRASALSVTTDSMLAMSSFENTGYTKTIIRGTHSSFVLLRVSVVDYSSATYGMYLYKYQVYGINGLFYWVRAFLLCTYCYFSRSATTSA